MNINNIFIGQNVTLTQPKGGQYYGIITKYVYGEALTGLSTKSENMVYAVFPFNTDLGESLVAVDALTPGWNFHEVVKIPDYLTALRNAAISSSETEVIQSVSISISALKTSGIKPPARPRNYISQGREVAPTQAESFIEEKPKFPTQQDAIIEILHTAKSPLHAREVQSALNNVLGIQMLLTSVRRALSVLDKAGTIKADAVRFDTATKKNVKAYYIPRPPKTGQQSLFT